MNENALREQLEAIGHYKPFDCDYCRKRGNFVSGPHGHVCKDCGGHATYGWYNTPRCAACFAISSKG